MTEAAAEGSVVHWIAEGGYMHHAVHDVSDAMRGSGDEDEVTCDICLAAIAEATR